ncbi:hypothetical protein DSM106972_061350 [Dulcicalothrix desertica PCC 7102]|uniref:Uncharacterized protein n=1 Tax=Dulcicalothrix desertica PCC 7102 TaxID=232991 RepID=A0A433V7H9_9CYAN|nr:hypothetical protein DSM106972_061350 [Dulcicalothrix desertica PCC 7102]
MRANTGNAVIDIAAPRNKANAVNGTLLIETKGYSITAKKVPRQKGTNILICDVNIAVSKLPVRYFGFNSNPIKNMKNINPTCDSTFKKGTASEGNKVAANPGATRPSSEGPSIIPATISPITNG